MRACKTCALLQGTQCGLTGRTLDLEKDFCSQYKKEVLVCASCGNIPIVPNIVDTNKGVICLCDNCAASGYCSSCEHNQGCSFETDPSPLPLYTVQQIRQGNSILQTQVKNPARIDITCKVGCPCWKDRCLKEDNTCENYLDVLRKEP